MSETFNNQSIIARHRAINQTLSNELKSGVHALSIVAKTPEQWNASNVVSPSPSCAGGMKHEAKMKAASKTDGQ